MPGSKGFLDEPQHIMVVFTDEYRDFIEFPRIQLRFIGHLLNLTQEAFKNTYVNKFLSADFVVIQAHWDGFTE